MEADKELDNKSRVDLIPPKVILLEGQAFRYGAKKYSEDNWRKGISQRTYGGAAMRHLLAHLDGCDTDFESGLPHLSHARACIAMMQQSCIEGLGEDDRPRRGTATHKVDSITIHPKSGYDDANGLLPGCSLCTAWARGENDSGLAHSPGCGV